MLDVLRPRLAAGEGLVTFINANERDVRDVSRLKAIVTALNSGVDPSYYVALTNRRLFVLPCDYPSVAPTGAITWAEPYSGVLVRRYRETPITHGWHLTLERTSDESVMAFSGVFLWRERARQIAQTLGASH